MKKLIMINGTMGVGKTAVCERLYKRLKHSVRLDGDWCWMMHPFTPSEENRNMVEDNIVYLLNNFLQNPSFEYVLFNWVLHIEDIMDRILHRLIDIEFKVIKITLLCSEEALKERISKDIVKGVRGEEAVFRSLERLALYRNMNTIKLDTTHYTIEDTVEEIIKIINRN